MVKTQLQKLSIRANINLSTSPIETLMILKINREYQIGFSDVRGKNKQNIYEDNGVVVVMKYGVGIKQAVSVNSQRKVPTDFSEQVSMYEIQKTTGPMQYIVVAIKYNQYVGLIVAQK